MPNYYYAIDQERRGPVSLDELRAAAISGHTLVWREGLPDWLPAREYAELSDLFRTNVPPPPRPAQHPPAMPSRESYPSSAMPAGSTLPKPMPGARATGGEPHSQSGPRPSPRRTTYDALGGPPPKTWLVESILATVLCCLPLGIAGIVNASKVESCYYAGDYDGAVHYSREAGKFTKIAVGVGVLIYVSYLAMFILGIIDNLD